MKQEYKSVLAILLRVECVWSATSHSTRASPFSEDQGIGLIAPSHGSGSTLSLRLKTVLSTIMGSPGLPALMLRSTTSFRVGVDYIDGTKTCGERPVKTNVGVVHSDVEKERNSLRAMLWA